MPQSRRTFDQCLVYVINQQTLGSICIQESSMNSIALVSLFVECSYCLIPSFMQNIHEISNAFIDNCYVIF